MIKSISAVRLVCDIGGCAGPIVEHPNLLSRGDVTVQAKGTAWGDALLSNAKRSGWTFVKEKHVCPSCAETIAAAHGAERGA